VNAVYLSDRTLYGAPLWEWSGPHGILACSQPPLIKFLAAPRLPPELAQHLQQAQQAQQGQQQQQQQQQQQEEA
jgi:hypothetical protein